MKFLPDTNVIIELFLKKGTVKDFFQDQMDNDQLFLSPITIAEINPKTREIDKKGLQEFILSAMVVPVDIDIAFKASDYRQEFSQKTKKVYLLDCLIAATCEVYGLTLVTNNIKDYPMNDIKIIQPK